MSAVQMKQPNPIDIAVGTKVRERRLMLGLSQDGLAKNVGVTFQQVQKYEKGMNRMGASRLQAIATVLQVPVAFFFQGSEAGLVPHTASALELEVAAFTATREGRELNRAFANIRNPTVRRDMLAVIESLAAAG